MPREAAIARNLVASTHLSPEVLHGTVYDRTITQPVIRRRAECDVVLCGIPLHAGQEYLLVGMKFAYRYYVVTRRQPDGQLVCSCLEERPIPRILAQAQAFLDQFPEIREDESRSRMLLAEARTLRVMQLDGEDAALIVASDAEQHKACWVRHNGTTAMSCSCRQALCAHMIAASLFLAE